MKKKTNKRIQPPKDGTVKEKPQIKERRSKKAKTKGTKETKQKHGDRVDKEQYQHSSGI